MASPVRSADRHELSRRVLCLVTDRRRLAQRLGLPLDNASRILCRQLAGAMAGGVQVVQIREPDLEGRAYVGLVREVVAIAAPFGVRVLVNDRIDVAVSAGADGVHLRENSVSVAHARQLLSGLIGRSVHDPATSGAADADYLIAGTVFATETKPGAPDLLGVDGLAAVVGASGDRPVWGIGGITHENVGAVVRAGASGVAAIGAFIPSGPAPDVEAAVEKLARTLRFSFDSAAELL